VGVLSRVGVRRALASRRVQSTVAADTMHRVMSARRKRSYDPAKARGPRVGPDVGEGPAPDGPTDKRPAAAMSVSALIGQIKAALAEAFPKKVCVVGEISNLTMHTSGHVYFRLKDAASAIDAVMFRSHASRLKFRPDDGLEVVVEGRVDVYDVRGQLQLYVERMTPRGEGALELAFRQLRQKLATEGLFAPEHKKPICRFPRAIGVVTSPTGAAIRDIRRTLGRRWPAARVYLLPTRVQGDQAAEEIARAVHLLDANAPRFGIDTLLVARGGGSLEDLWPFNEEIVARAIYAAVTPVICGVGHEVDVTIADLVADVRAATPTAAAELAVPDGQEIARRVAAWADRLRRIVTEQIAAARSALEAVLRSGVFRDPTARLRTQTQHLDELSHRLRAGLGEELARQRRRLEPAANRLAALHPARLADRARAGLDRITRQLAWVLGARSKAAGDRLAAVHGRMLGVHPMHRLRLARHEVAAAARQLEAMHYRNVLRRGFSVTRSPEGAILRSVAQVRPQQPIETELADGKFTSRVDGGAPQPAGASADTISRSPPPARRPASPRRKRRRGPHPGPSDPTLFEL